MFNEDICSYPCPRFVSAGTDEDTGMIFCKNCHMMFVSDDPINFGGAEDESTGGSHPSKRKRKK